MSGDLLGLWDTHFANPGQGYHHHPPAGWPYYHPTTAQWRHCEPWPTAQPQRGSNSPGAGAGAGLWVQGSRGHEIGDVLEKGKDTRLRVKGHLGGVVCQAEEAHCVPPQHTGHTRPICLSGGRGGHLLSPGQTRRSQFGFRVCGCSLC